MKIKAQLPILLLGLICINSGFADEKKTDGGIDLTPKSVSVEEADAIDNKPFLYAYDPSITEEIQENYYDRMVKGGLAAELALENMELFTPQNMQSFTDEVFKDTGFKSNNAVDVQAMYLLANIFIAKETSIPVSGDIAIRNGIKKDVADKGTYNNLSDREKQEQTENLMLSIFDMVSNYGHLKRSDQSTVSVVSHAKNNLRSMGIKFGMMTVGENGYVMEPWVEGWISDYVKQKGEEIDGAKMVEDLFAESAKREE